MSKKRAQRRSAERLAAKQPARRRRGWLSWKVLIWLAPLAFIGVRIWPQATDRATSAAPAPPFQVTTLNGRTVSDDQLRGKVVLINFWATWCPPCRAEMPGFESVYEKHAGSDFVVLGVAMDAGGMDGVQSFLAARHITYPVAMATSSMVQEFGGVQLLPNSFLLDRQGRIRNEVRGAYDAATLDRQVTELLAEP